jgi:hypothetical protein
MRSLHLKSERLAELTTDDLHRVRGAAGTLSTNPDCVSIVVDPFRTFRACTTAQSCGCEPSWNCS